MSITIDQIKQLRELSGVSMTDCKKALIETKGDQEKAIIWLRTHGISKASAKVGREAKEGLITSYIHSNHKIGVLLEINCETDFVARDENFVLFSKDLAMQIAATAPYSIAPEEISQELIIKEREIWQEQLKNEGKPENMLDKILEGKEKKFRDENSLLKQAFIKNSEITIEKLLAEKIAAFGENIKIKRFARFQI